MSYLLTLQSLAGEPCQEVVQQEAGSRRNKELFFLALNLGREPNLHIRIRTDNTTALAYVNMGGAHTGQCLAVAKEILT